MRKLVLGALAASLSLAGFSAAALAQETKPSTTAKSQAFDPHDLTGIWGGQSIANLMKGEPPMTPAALAKYKSEKTEFSKPPALADNNTDPVLRCDPAGVPRIYFFAHPMKVIQTPSQILFLYEADRIYRTVYMNRQHPEHPDATWYGDSIGKWEGNTLVVDTTGFNDKTWLDRPGHPHSEQLHLIERFTRTDRDHLQLDITIEDPVDYSKSWGGQRIFKLEPASWRLEEYMCSPEDEAEVLKKVMEPEAAPAGQK